MKYFPLVLFLLSLPAHAVMGPNRLAHREDKMYEDRLDMQEKLREKKREIIKLEQELKGASGETASAVKKKLELAREEEKLLKQDLTKLEEQLDRLTSILDKLNQQQRPNIARRPGFELNQGKNPKFELRKGEEPKEEAQASQPPMGSAE